MSEWVKSAEDLRELFSYVLLSAPDEFPEEDFLSADEQMNLERAFSELITGVEFFIRENQSECLRVLAESLVAYRRGEDVAAAHLLQAAERLAFESA